MERLTEKTIGCFLYDLKDFSHKVGEFADYDAFYAYSMAVKRLGEFEDSEETGTPMWAPAPLGAKVVNISNNMQGEIIGYEVNKYAGKGILMHFPDKECGAIDEDGTENVNPIYFASHYKVVKESTQ